MEGTIAEIRFFAGNFAPMTWAFCDGQLQSIAQNTALFALIGTIYGGDGVTTFALPDFRGRIPVGTGSGPGLSSITEGEMAGTETVTLLTTNLPVHTHNIAGTVAMGARNGAGNSASPSGNYPAAVAGSDFYSTSADAQMAALTGGMTAANTGSNSPVDIRAPFLGMNIIICLEGIFPSRN